MCLATPMDTHCNITSTRFRVLEFYSGIGGMRFALEKARVPAVVVEAFDINEIANDVYEHNFGQRPHQGNIQHLTMQELEKYDANVWLLSPPCQPYTRQGLQKDVEDSRAASFLKILQILPFMSRSPTHVFVENVVGFESSVTHSQLMAILRSSDFVTQEFILTPLQFGIPYSRPRYFCLAKKKPLGFLQPTFDGQLLYTPCPLQVAGEKLPSKKDSLLTDGTHQNQQTRLSQRLIDPVISCWPIRNYLESDMVNFLSFQVPNTLIERLGGVFDIVTPDSQRCCCFTKSYVRFVKGTGSFLATKKCLKEDLSDFSYVPKDHDTSKMKDHLKQMELRYFTPREVANLHSFPQEFSFPDHVTLKQRYALLGNSLSGHYISPSSESICVILRCG
eukprot:c22360_g1_i2 orf=217-1389(-)